MALERQSQPIELSYHIPELKGRLFSRRLDTMPTREKSPPVTLVIDDDLLAHSASTE